MKEQQQELSHSDFLFAEKNLSLSSVKFKKNSFKFKKCKSLY